MMKILCLTLLCVPSVVFAGSGLPDRPYIYVSGNAEIEKPPDTLTMKFDVVGTGDDLPKANQDVQAKAQKTFAILQEQKIEKKDIIAEGVHTEPQFEEQENYGHRQSKLIGYKVTRDFNVKIRDLAVYPKLVDQIIGLGAAEFNDKVEGSLSKQKEIEGELWDKALQNAREHADKTAKTMGAKVDSIFAISDTPFAKIEDDVLGSGEERVVVTGMNIPPPAPAPEYHFANIKLSQTVHVLYLISPAK